MTDVFSRQKRSEIMAAIRSCGNQSTEGRMVSLLRRNRIVGWRRRQSVAGAPDFVFRRQKIAVFVDGCFWHGCPLHYRSPATHQKYWDEKIFKNQMRDRWVTNRLQSDGWQVVRFWEHDFSNESRIIARLVALLNTCKPEEPPA